MIPCANPLARYEVHRDEIDAAVQRVLCSGRYILDTEVESFEREFAEYVGIQCAVGVGSGTEALHIALLACGVGPGDEVITVSHTAVATVAAIELCGAVPVLVDIESDYYTMSPASMEAAITSKTKAVIPVHLYGQPADLVPLLDIAQHHGLDVIEDCAQAHGAFYHGKRVGAWADCGCFSFYPTKNLGAVGDGGMIVTDNPTLAQRARHLRQYGWIETRYVSQSLGLNSRLDELQAAVLRVKLRYLDADNAERMRLAELYKKGLTGTAFMHPACRPNATHVYHQYVIRSPERGRLQSFLARADIGTLVHYPIPVHLQPAFWKRLPAGKGLLVTEQVAQQVLSLPMYPGLADSDVQAVIKAIRTFSDGGEKMTLSEAWHYPFLLEEE